MPVYQEVATATIPVATRQAAQNALSYACARLGLALPPTIVWIRGSLADSNEAATGTVSYPLAINGLTKEAAWAMWVRADLSAYLTARVVAHEAAHLYHRLRNRPNALSHADEEADCEAFAAQVVEALGRQESKNSVRPCLPHHNLRPPARMRQKP